MADPPSGSSPGLRALLTAPGFPRLWSIGCCVNTMRWFDLLVAALFTLEVTGSGFAVAVVSAARTMPMLLFGAFAGVVTEALNRKHVLLFGQCVAFVASFVISLLAWFDLALPWHLGVAAFVSGVVWSTEMATRRRMVGECVPPALAARALALDTMSNSFTRMIGPVAAGVIYQTLGIKGSFIVSCGVYALAASLVVGLRYRQETRRLVLAQVPRELAEGVRFARGHVTIAGVLVVTIAMNLLGFPYNALIAPIGRLVFDVSPTWVGVLAAAESFGAFAGGVWLTSGGPRLSGPVLMVGGSLLFLASVILMPLMPFFTLACLCLAIAGFGSSAFANMQTALIVLHAPAHIRSRLMGLLTVCIGMGPLGILLIGGLAALWGPLVAIEVVEILCFVSVALMGVWWLRRERSG
jgi:MFS family permease